MKKIITGLVLASMISSTLFGNPISAHEIELEEGTDLIQENQEIEIDETQNEKTTMQEVELEELVELAQDVQEVEVVEEKPVERGAVTITPYVAPADWAFTEESKPLHDAILKKFPLIDINNDGWINVSEANSWTQNIAISGSTLDEPISGTINGIENFVNIKILDLRENNLTGSMEPATRIPNLQRLILFNNDFTGGIPVSLANQTMLNALYIENNPRLGGEIPDIFSSLPNLRHIYLSNLGLVGGLPKSIYNQPNLIVLMVSRNKLNTDISTDIGKLTSLTSLHLSDNEFYGDIPEELGNLTKLQQFRINNNQFTSIPESIGNLTALNQLFAENNQLTKLPSSMQNLSSLVHLFLSMNDLDTDLSILSNLPKLYRLDLAHNPKLKGESDTLFATTPSLWALTVSGTSMNQKRPNNPALKVFFYDLLNEEGNDLREGVTLDDVQRLLDEYEILTDGKSDSDYWTGKTGSVWVLDVVSVILDKTKLAGEMIEIKEKIEDFTNEEGNINNDLTQETIDDAKNAVEKLPEGPLKENLKDKLDDIQNQYNEKEAEKLVGDLTDENGNIKDDVTQDTIDDAKNAVEKLPEGPKKEELKDKLDDIQDQFDEREAEKLVGDLVDENGNIKDDVTQDTIDDAKNAVEKLPEGPKKDELKDKLDGIQEQLDEKTASFTILTQFETYTGQLSISARIDAPSARVSKVYLNGVVLDPSLYSITEGSTIVTLKKEALSTLSNGDYIVTVEYMAGNKVNLPLTVNVAKASETPLNGKTTNTNDIVTTGENMNTSLFYSLAFISLGSILFIVSKRKKFNK